MDYGEKLYLGIVSLNGVDYVALYLDDCKACIKKARKLSRKFRIRLSIKEVFRDTDTSLHYQDITTISCGKRKQGYRAKKWSGDTISENLNLISISSFSDESKDTPCLGLKPPASFRTDKTYKDNKSNIVKPEKKRVSLSELFI